MFLWQLSLVSSRRLVTITKLQRSVYSVFEYVVLLLPDTVLMGNWILTPRGQLPRYSDILSCTAMETSKLTSSVLVRYNCRLRAKTFSLLSSYTHMVSKPNIICRTLKWNTWFRTQGKLEWWPTLRHLPSRKTVLVMSDKIVFQYIYILFNQKRFLVGYGWSGIRPSTNMEGNVGLARGKRDCCWLWAVGDVLSIWFVWLSLLIRQNSLQKRPK